MIYRLKIGWSSVELLIIFLNFNQVKFKSKSSTLQSCLATLTSLKAIKKTNRNSKKHNTWPLIRTWQNNKNQRGEELSKSTWSWKICHHNNNLKTFQRAVFSSSRFLKKLKRLKLYPREKKLLQSKLRMIQNMQRVSTKANKQTQRCLKMFYLLKVTHKAQAISLTK